MLTMEIEELKRRTRAFSKEERKVILEEMPVDELLEAVSSRYNALVEKNSALSKIFQE